MTALAEHAPPPAPAPPGLAVFDMDGTLIPGTTACRQIGLAAGDVATVERLEREYRAGLIDSTAFADHCLTSWERAGDGLYRTAFAGCPKIGGLEEALARLRARSYVTCLITMSPRPFAELFDGFDHVFASTYPTDILDPEDKPLIVDRLRRRLGLRLDQVVAFGDADSDVPLFRALTRTVAVNSTPNLRELAAHHYDGDDIAHALRMVLPDEETEPAAAGRNRETGRTRPGPGVTAARREAGSGAEAVR
ncbi:HAD family hydrolase [Streptomyces sp. NRRL F-5727]|uniref:HAD family hydrolase n=1 Tax=Streptomyces sp. NRRL F-5727 TaxID=1463871 RepID=UPI00068F6F75|nr:haloacid dehalogenase-like hydrolase [Streptomyces sp. NRRL F-5727]